MMRPLLLALLLTAVAAPTPLAGKVVTGIAVDPQGQPVAGAAVWLPPDGSMDVASYLQAGPAMVTGTDGRFTVSLPAGRENIKIEVCRPDSLTTRIDAGLAGDRPVTVVISPGARISGQVVDADGAPVTGLWMIAQRTGDPPDVFFGHGCNASGDVAVTTTDSEGRFVLGSLAPNWYTVQGANDLFEMKTVRLASGQALDGVRFAVEHNLQVAGQVTEPDGSPVPAAVVCCGMSCDATDAAGHYRLTHLTPGLKTVSAYDGHVHSCGVSREVEIGAGENRLDLEFPSSREVHGRVLGPGGEPAAGAIVTAFSARTATAADGTFHLRIPGCYPLWTILRVQATGLAPTEVTVQEGSDADEIRLTRTGALTGRVLGLPAPAGPSHPERKNPENQP